jgi:hypothetical protein
MCLELVPKGLRFNASPSVGILTFRLEGGQTGQDDAAANGDLFWSNPPLSSEELAKRL